MKSRLAGAAIPAAAPTTTLATTLATTRAATLAAALAAALLAASPCTHAVVDGPGDYKGNYGMNWGQGAWGQNNTRRVNSEGLPAELGPFERKRDNPGVEFRQITDGLSKTMLFLEMIQAPTEERRIDRRGRLWKAYAGSNQITTHAPPNTSQDDQIQQCIDQPDQNLPCTTSVAFLEQTMASRSRHPGGVNAVMCDGSVQYFADDVQLITWQALSSMAAGDIEGFGTGEEATTTPRR